MGREKKVGLVLALVVLAAASVVAYASPEMTLSLATSGLRLTEPGVMLISGSALLVVAGALRRMRV